MPQNRQAERRAGYPAWSWYRLAGAASAVMALGLCAAFVSGLLRAVETQWAIPYGLYDPPLPPSLLGYAVFALLLLGAIVALWKGDIWLLLLGWLVTLATALVDFWMVWRMNPTIFQPWGALREPLFLFVLIGTGLAWAGRNPQTGSKPKT